MKLKIFIVCYNQPISSIPYIHNESIPEECSILIFDNSDREEILEYNELYSKEMGIVYFTEGKNIGLSKAYNRLLTKIEISKNNWIITLDQDTNFPREYFENIIISIKNKNSCPIKSGIIYFGDNIGSPKNFKKEKFGIFEDIDIINSGLTIRSDVLKEVDGYDEDIFLDMVDYKLIYDLKIRGYNRIEIVPGIISQDFSGNDYTNIETVKNRYAIFKSDFKTFCKKTNKSILWYYFIILKRKANIYLKGTI